MVRDTCPLTYLLLSRVVHEGRKGGEWQRPPPVAINRSGSVVREAAAPHRQSPMLQRDTSPPPPPPPPPRPSSPAAGAPMAPPDVVAPDPVPSISPTDARAAARAERRARRALRTSEGDEQMEI